MIKTERTVIRRFTPGDLEAFYRMGSDPDVVRYTADPGGGFRDREHAREALQSHPIADYEKHGFGRMAVELISTGEVIGFAGLKYLDEFDEVDLAYRLFPEHWGQGLATEVGRASLRYGFGELGLAEIVAFALPANRGSIHVLEKLGFTRVGKFDYDGQDALRFVIRNPDRRD